MQTQTRVGRPRIGKREEARLYPGQRAAVQAHCDITGETFAEFIRAAVDEKLDRLSRKART